MNVNTSFREKKKVGEENSGGVRLNEATSHFFPKINISGKHLRGTWSHKTQTLSGGVERYNWMQLPHFGINDTDP